MSSTSWRSLLRYFWLLWRPYKRWYQENLAHLQSPDDKQVRHVEVWNNCDVRHEEWVWPMSFMTCRAFHHCYEAFFPLIWKTLSVVDHCLFVCLFLPFRPRLLFLSFSDFIPTLPSWYSLLESQTALNAHHVQKKIIKRKQDRRPLKSRLSDINRNNVNLNKCITKVEGAPAEYTLVSAAGTNNCPCWIGFPYVSSNNPHLDRFETYVYDALMILPTKIIDPCNFSFPCTKSTFYIFLAFHVCF